VSRRAVFLDRDGVLNERPLEHDYVRDIADLRLLPEIAKAAARLRGAGYALIVASNQRGVARGLVSQVTLARIENAIQDELATAGAWIDAFYYCPHDLDENCDCRKPRPGLLLRAADELELDLASSAFVGDSETDVAAGRAAGVFTVRVGGGATAADLEAADLADAAQLLAARAISAS
jgi:D-glycero-D-manno-heptose 1,7-bisphosphate phosphatase